MKGPLYPPKEGGPRPPAGWVLWASFLATPVLWFGWFMAAYVFNEAVCGAVERVDGALALPGNAIPLASAVVVTLAMVALTWFSARVRRRARRTREIRDDFLPRVGVLTGLLFILAMVAHVVQLALVGPC